MEVAERLRAFPPHLVYYAGTDGGMPARGGRGPTPGAAEYQSLLRANHPVPFLLSLLKDRNPKIRTLAAAALVAKGDPRLLQHLGPLLDDQSRTFDQITMPRSAAYLPGDLEHASYSPQTVATAALRLVEKRSKAEFDQYWASHGNRQHCADWFLWQFRHERFASVAREQIGSVPSPDRELITLWIGTGQKFRYAGFSEEEILAAAKHLGRQGVLEVLRNQPSTTDPDILHSGGFGIDSPYQHYTAMGLFLLWHARDLLEFSDADILLGLESAERNRKNSPEPVYREWWPIAAASLRPKNADAILDAAETRWPQAGNIPLARWDIEGPASLPKILAWFYRSPKAQDWLARAIYDADRNERYQPLAKAVLSSEGRLKIDGEAMYRFASLAEMWKVHFDRQFVDWVFSQPPDPHPESMNRWRELVVRISGVAAKLVRDPRFSKADAQLLYDVEQCLVGGGKLSRPESVRLDQLIRKIDMKNPQSTPESDREEIRNLLRKVVGDT